MEALHLILTLTLCGSILGEEVEGQLSTQLANIDASFKLNSRGGVSIQQGAVPKDELVATHNQLLEQFERDVSQSELTYDAYRNPQPSVDTPYQWAYEVNAASTGDQKSQIERREEDGIVRGRYSVVDPDGFLRTVTYVAHPDNGFQATVNRQETLQQSINPVASGILAYRSQNQQGYRNQGQRIVQRQESSSLRESYNTQAQSQGNYNSLKQPVNLNQQNRFDQRQSSQQYRGQDQQLNQQQYRNQQNQQEFRNKQQSRNQYREQENQFNQQQYRNQQTQQSRSQQKPRNQYKEQEHQFDQQQFINQQNQQQLRNQQESRNQYRMQLNQFDQQQDRNQQNYEQYRNPQNQKQFRNQQLYRNQVNQQQYSNQQNQQFEGISQRQYVNADRNSQQFPVSIRQQQQYRTQQYDNSREQGQGINIQSTLATRYVANPQQQQLRYRESGKQDIQFSGQHPQYQQSNQYNSQFQGQRTGQVYQQRQIQQGNRNIEVSNKVHLVDVEGEQGYLIQSDGPQYEVVPVYLRPARNIQESDEDNDDDDDDDEDEA